MNYSCCTFLYFSFFISVLAINFGNQKTQFPWYSSLPFNQAIIPNAYHWMESIKSSTNISSLAIPGTHDSCADSFRNENPLNRQFIEFFTQTQSWPLEDQLIAGIRYLDIRAGTDGNIYHAFFQTSATLNGVFQLVTSFLTKYPSEGIIMRVQKNIKSDCKTDECTLINIYDVFDKYFPFLYLSNDIPLVADIRGKIFLILEELEYDNAMNWNSELIYLQDNYKMMGEINQKIAKKKKSILEYLIKSKEKKYFIINHCSASGILITTIKTIAQNENKVPYKENGFSGIFPMDYPGEQLIQHLINQNKEFEVATNFAKNNEIYSDLDDQSKDSNIPNEKSQATVYIEE